MKIFILVVFLLSTVYAFNGYAGTYICNRISIIDQRGYNTDKDWEFKYDSSVEHRFEFSFDKDSVVVPIGKRTIVFPIWKKYNNDISTTYKDKSAIVKNTYKDKLTFYFVDSKIPVNEDQSNIEPVFMAYFSECYIED